MSDKNKTKHTVNLATTSEKAQSKKPQMIGMDLVLPAAADMREVLLGPDAANKLKTVPFSDDTVKRRIKELSTDIQGQLAVRFCFANYLLFRWTCSRDVSRAAQQVCYPWVEDILEDFLFRKDDC